MGGNSPTASSSSSSSDGSVDWWNRNLEATVETGKKIFETLFGTKPDEGAIQSLHDQRHECHYVLLVKIPDHVELPTTFKTKAGARPDKCIFRVARNDCYLDALAPLQVRQEIGVRKNLQAKVGDKVPQPRIYAWNDAADGKPIYVAEECVEGKTLNSVWWDWDDTQRASAMWSLAKMHVALADHDFTHICGIDADGVGITPPIDLSRKYARASLFVDKAYDIGPYKSQADYILAQFDKESKFWASDIPKSFGAWNDEDTERFGTQADYSKLILTAKDKVAEHLCDLERDGSEKPERFVIQHGHLHNNILWDKATAKIVAVRSWEFAVVMPVSQFWIACNDTDRAVLEVGFRELSSSVDAGEKGRAELDRINKQRRADGRDELRWERFMLAIMCDMLEARGWRTSHIKRLNDVRGPLYMPLEWVRYGCYLADDVVRPSEEGLGRFLEDEAIPHEAWLVWRELDSGTDDDDDADTDQVSEGGSVAASHAGHHASKDDKDAVSEPASSPTAASHKNPKVVVTSPKA